MNDERGAAALMVIVIILAVAILVVSSTALTGIDDLEIGFSHSAGSRAVLSAQSCAEEAMLKLSRDNSFVGGTLAVGEATCTMIVTGTPCGACTIGVESTQDTFTRSIEVDVTVTGSQVDITSWREVD